jgi:predicted ATPase/DNA-binding CsgD family transcriptional regulator
MLTPFVGRADEVTRVDETLERARIVTLAGPGGAGKTRLALEVASRRAGAYSDGVFCAELARIDDDALVARSVLGLLGIAEETTRPASATLVEHLRARRVLLVLDNCEHVLDAVAVLADELLRACPGVALLTTTREPLGLGGEHVCDIDGLAADDARTLFVQRAAAARAGFALDSRTAPLIDEVCCALEGMPLAIELAAARLRQMPLPDIVAGLGRSLRLLSHGPRVGEARHRSLRASLDWSHGLLDDHERCLYRRFAVFAGGAGHAAAARVCAGDPVEPFEVGDLLGALVEKSLVRFEETPDGARYRMLEAVRQHAAEQLDATEADVVRGRHLELARDVTDVVAARVDLDPMLPRIEAELGNLRAALEHALATDPATALRITAALDRFWVFGGHFREGLDLHRRVLAADDGRPSAERALVLSTTATLAQYVAEHEQAFALAEEGLACALECEDERAVGRASHVLGSIIGWFDPPRGVALAQDGVAALRRAGSGGDVAWALVGLGINLGWQDEHARAAAATDEAVGLTGDRAIAAYRELLEWWRLVERGDLHGSEAAARRGMAVADGRVPMLGDIFDLGVAAARVWRGDAAAVIAGARLALDRTAAQSPMATSALHSILALAELAAGDLAGLRRRVEELSDGWQHYHAVEATGLLALADLADGDAAAAGRRVAVVRESAQRMGNARFAALADLIDGRVALERGDTARARSLLHAALGAFAERDMRLRQPSAIEALGAVAAAEEDWPVAARLLAAAEAGYRELGSVRIPEDPDRWTPLREAAAAADPAAWEQGASMTIEQVVAYARRGRGPRERPLKGWASLTPTEAEVATLVAGGATNPQVAEQLFMSRATVKRHLAHAFDKLGVSSRTELAAWVAAHPVDGPAGEAGRAGPGSPKTRFGTQP